jgi:hypothetical protein
MKWCKKFTVKDQNGRIFKVKISSPSKLYRLFGIMGHTMLFSKNIWISSEEIDSVEYILSDNVDYILRHEIAHHYVPLRKKFFSRLMPAFISLWKGCSRTQACPFSPLSNTHARDFLFGGSPTLGWW